MPDDAPADWADSDYDYTHGSDEDSVVLAPPPRWAVLHCDPSAARGTHCPPFETAHTRARGHRARRSQASTRRKGSDRRQRVETFRRRCDDRDPGRLGQQEGRRTDEAAAEQYEGRAKCPGEAGADGIRGEGGISGNSSSSWEGEVSAAEDECGHKQYLELWQIRSSVRGREKRKKSSRNGGGRCSPSGRQQGSVAGSTGTQRKDEEGWAAKTTGESPGRRSHGKDKECRRSKNSDDRTDRRLRQDGVECGEGRGRERARERKIENQRNASDPPRYTKRQRGTVSDGDNETMQQSPSERRCQSRGGVAASLKSGEVDLFAGSMNV